MSTLGMLDQTVIMINNEFIFCKKIVFQNVALVEFAGNQMRKIRLYSVFKSGHTLFTS